MPILIHACMQAPDGTNTSALWENAANQVEHSVLVFGGKIAWKRDRELDLIVGGTGETRGEVSTLDIGAAGARIESHGALSIPPMNSLAREKNTACLRVCSAQHGVGGQPQWEKNKPPKLGVAG